MNRAESNYSTIERELLAIVWAVKHFRPYLYGRKFKLVSDHKPLIWIFNLKDPSSRLFRWKLFLEPQEFTIHHKKGKHNSNADALSRISNTEIIDFIDIKTKVFHPKIHNIRQSSLVIDDSYRNSSYSDFLDKLNNSVIVNDNLRETTDSLLSFKDNYAICISRDLNSSDNILKELEQKFSHKQIIEFRDPHVREVTVINNGKFKIYYLVIKSSEFDDVDFEDVFQSFTNLKELLLKEKVNSITIPYSLILRNQQKTELIRPMLRYVFKRTNIKINLCCDSKYCPKNAEIDIILNENHTSLTGGHLGFHKTYERIRERYKWKNMKLDIFNFVKNCISCQTNKLVRNKRKNPMTITTTSNRPFQKIALDIVGPFPITQSGNQYILTIQDDLTKFFQAYPIPNHEAQTVAKILVNRYICLFGIPDKLLTDQGREFTSNLFKNVARQLKIKQIQTTPYHPQSNGTLERTHQTLADYLKHFVNDNQTDWDEYIELFSFSYNTAVHASTNYTPYELIFGTKATLPSSITKPPEFNYCYDDYLINLIQKFRKIREIARNNLTASKQKNKTYYDKKSKATKYKVGDKIYLKIEQFSKSKKLSARYKGPFKILEVISPTYIAIQQNRKRVIVHVDNTKPYHATHNA